MRTMSNQIYRAEVQAVERLDLGSITQQFRKHQHVEGYASL